MNKLIIFIIPFLIMVESSGNPNPPDGDDGAAVGILQIHRKYWIDGTEYGKVDWPYSDARNPDKSIQVATWYLERWGKHWEKEHGKPVTIETLARMHNGGPHFGKRSTQNYWKRVKEVIEKNLQNSRNNI
jgi:soluble lytic murein transglycosylase-like protein